MKKLLFVLVFIPYFSFSQKGEGYVIQHRPIQDAQVSQTEVKIDSDFKVATINAERNLLAMANKDNTVVYFNLDENTIVDQYRLGVWETGRNQYVIYDLSKILLVTKNNWLINMYSEGIFFIYVNELNKNQFLSTTRRISDFSIIPDKRYWTFESYYVLFDDGNYSCEVERIQHGILFLQNKINGTKIKWNEKKYVVPVYNGSFKSPIRNLEISPNYKLLAFSTDSTSLVLMDISKSKKGIHEELLKNTYIKSKIIDLKFVDDKNILLLTDSKLINVSIDGRETQIPIKIEKNVKEIHNNVESGEFLVTYPNKIIKYDRLFNSVDSIIVKDKVVLSAFIKNSGEIVAVCNGSN